MPSAPPLAASASSREAPQEKSHAWAITLPRMAMTPGLLSTYKDNFASVIRHNPRLAGKLQARMVKAAHNQGNNQIVLECIDPEGTITIQAIRELWEQAAANSAGTAGILQKGELTPYQTIEPRPAESVAVDGQGKNDGFVTLEAYRQLLAVVQARSEQVNQLEAEIEDKSERLEALEAAQPVRNLANALVIELRDFTSAPEELKKAELWFPIAAKQLGLTHVNVTPELIGKVCAAVWKARAARDAKDKPYYHEFTPQERAAYDSLSAQGHSDHTIRKRIEEAARTNEDAEKSAADKRKTIGMIEAIKEGRAKEVFATQPTQEMLDIFARQDVPKLKQDLQALEEKAKFYKAAKVLMPAYERVDAAAATTLTPEISMGMAVIIDKEAQGPRTIRILTPVENPFLNGFLRKCILDGVTSTSEVISHMSLLAMQLKPIGIRLHIRIIDNTLLRNNA